MVNTNIASSSNSSSNRTSSDQDEYEKEILMAECQGSSATSEVDPDEGYDFKKARPQRRRILRAHLGQLGRMLRIGRLQRDIQSLISHPEVQKSLGCFISAQNREKLQQLFITFLLFLLPSFIYPWSPISKPKELGKMAYLDGLRGVAALFVMGHHYVCQFAPALLEGWGTDIQADGTNENRWIFQLPLIRVIHSGPFMVNLFFIISGCVLSARGLKLARERKKPEFMSSLASSVFRRWFRLHLPVIASMFIAFIIARNEGWTHLQRDWLAPPGAVMPNSTTIVKSNLTIFTPAPFTNVTVVHEDLSANMTHLLGRSNVLRKPKFRLQWDWTGAKKNESLTWQVNDFFWGVVNVCDPFNPGAIPGVQSAGYNAGMILWTIPQEWLGSIVVFFVVLGIAWTRTWLKLSILTLMVFWCHYCGRPAVATFLTGVIIAELTLMREERLASQTDLQSTDLPIVTDEKASSSNPVIAFLTFNREEITTISWDLLFLTGIWMGSVPLISWPTSPGFRTLYYLIPSWYFYKDIVYPCLGSFFIMLSLTQSPPLQRIFQTPFPQYLGRISFSLYLLHTQILTTVGIRVFTGTMKFVGGGESQVGFGMGLLLGGAVMGPFTF